MIDIESLFPEIRDIQDTSLRNSVLAVWKTAVERGGWKSIEHIPFTLLLKSTEQTLIQHTRKVTKMALAIADVRGDINRDYVIAAALLHDVGKLLEYTEKDGEIVLSDFGKLVRHPISGAAVAMECGLPDEIVHAIAAHSKEGESVKRTPLAILINHCDFIDFEIAKAKQ